MITKAHSKQIPILRGVHVNSSIYDKIIRVVIGRCKIGMDMTWTGNFQVHQSNSKKGKTGKKGASGTTYSAGFDFLAGFGPLITTGTVYQNKDNFWNAFVSSQQFTPSGNNQDWSDVITNNPGPFLNIIAITVQKPYSVSFNDYGGPGVVALAGNFNENLYNKDAIPLFVLNSGQGQDYCSYAIGNSADVSWSVHIDAGITDPIITVYYMYEGSTITPFQLQSNGGTGLMLETTFGNGTEFNYPGGSSFQIQYPELWGFGGPSVDMGTSNTAPNYTSEVVCWGNYSTTGDASPADFLLGIITSGNFWPSNPTTSCWAWGLGFEGKNSPFGTRPNILADPPVPAPGQTGVIAGPFSKGLEAVRQYCDAYGIYISGSFEQQRSAADYIDEISEIANCAVVWNGNKLNFIPRCEVSAVGNGAIYIAPTASGPIYTIDDSVLIVESANEDPVTAVRNEKLDPRAIPNILPIQHHSRGSGFYTETVSTYRDGASLAQFGPIPDSSKNWPWIQQADTAIKAAAPVLKRKLLVDPLKIKFKLPISHCLLDPWDLVLVRERAFMWDSTFSFTRAQQSSIRTNNQGADLPVRITSLEENDKRIISIEAEPFIYGAHSPSNQTPAISIVSTPVAGGIPLSVNTPIIFEPVNPLSGGTEQLWIAVSDTDAIYGGCSIYMSTDGGNNYTLIGALSGNSAMGTVYNSNYPSSPDPDATDTLYADLTESAGALGTFSTADRDNFVSLCYVEPGGTTTLNGKTVTIPYELVSYASVTLQTSSKYAINPTIRRNIYNTPNVAHNVNQNFAYVGAGSNLFKYDLPVSLIGKTLYFKFAAFDLYGRNTQPLDTCIAYPFTPTGLGVASPLLSYTLNPPIVLYQGKTGGWPGISTGSANWTDPADVYIPPFTVTWSDGVVANYSFSSTGTFASGGNFGEEETVGTSYLAADLTDNNTSAANTWSNTSNGDAVPADTSKVSIKAALYPGASTRVLAHMVAWFYSGSSHINIGYFDDQTQITNVVADMKSRGIDGIILDWYGQGSHSDTVAGYIKTACEADGSMTFAICVDKGAVNSGNSQTAFESAVAYVNSTYFNSSAYEKRSGRPLLLEFGCEKLSIDWVTVKAFMGTHGNPLFIWQDLSAPTGSTGTSGGSQNSFAASYTDGAFSWIGVSAVTGPDPEALNYLQGFYNSAKAHPSKIAMGSVRKGFNDALASWGTGRVMTQANGDTWADSFTTLNSNYSSSLQLPYLQVATWDDYEEGTEIETGIVTNFAFGTPTALGNVVSWTHTGETKPIDHIGVYASSNGGTSYTFLGQVAKLSTSVDLVAAFSLANGTYLIRLRAVGITSVQSVEASDVSVTITGSGLGVGVTTTYWTIPIIGTPPETLFGAIYDPARVGNSSQIYLDLTDRSTLAGYISLGSIFIADIITGGGSGTGVGTNLYHVWWSLPTKPDANIEYLIGKFPVTVTFPGNFVGSVGRCLTNPTATAVFTIKKNGVAVGTVSIATSGAFTFASTNGAAVVFSGQADYISVVTPTIQDATLADAGFVLVGTR